MIFKDKTSFTQVLPGVPAGGGQYTLRAFGQGTVTIECQGEDLVWRAYPETKVTAPAAVILELAGGSYRIVMAGTLLTAEWLWA